MLSRMGDVALVLALLAPAGVAFADAGLDTDGDADASESTDAGPADAMSDTSASADAASDAAEGSDASATDAADVPDDGVDLRSITPNYGYADSETEVEIRGNGLDNTVSFELAERAIVDLSFPNSSLAVGFVPSNQIAPGSYDLHAYRGGVEVAVLLDAFEVVAERQTAAPAIASVFPPVIVMGRAAELTVSGTGFAAGATVEFSGLRSTGVVVDGPEELRVSIDPAFFVTPGPYAVTIENPDGQSATLAGGLVVRPAPSDDASGCASARVGPHSLLGVALVALALGRRRRR